MCGAPGGLGEGESIFLGSLSNSEGGISSCQWRIHCAQFDARCFSKSVGRRTGRVAKVNLQSLQRLCHPKLGEDGGAQHLFGVGRGCEPQTPNEEDKKRHVLLEWRSRQFFCIAMSIRASNHAWINGWDGIVQSSAERIPSGGSPFPVGEAPALGGAREEFPTVQ